MKTSVFVARGVGALRGISPRNSAVTLGVFDGVHRGHSAILRELTEAKKRAGIDSAFVVTFAPHPLVVTHSKVTPPMLTTIDERIRLLSRFDVDGIVVLEFDRELANTHYRAFLERYLVTPFDMKLLVLGYDCRFGRNREGSAETALEAARKHGFGVEVVQAVRDDGAIVSSTKIRNALIEGDLEEANRLLGHPYLVAGTVVKGHGRGQELGFPTANLALSDPYKLWPPRGVYAVEAEHDGRTYQGMMNVGRAPTVKRLAEDASEVEVHLFDFKRDVYGERLHVYCHRYLRKEKRFPSVDALARQLSVDKTQALDYLAKKDRVG